MTSREIRNAIIDRANKFGHDNPQQFAYLLKILENETESDIFDGIMSVFESEEYSSQELAGRLLNEIKPNSSRDIELILLNILETWDKSIEQVPYYFADKVGEKKLNEILENIKSEILDDKKMINIETMIWWINSSN